MKLDEAMEYFRRTGLDGPLLEILSRADDYLGDRTILIMAQPGSGRWHAEALVHLRHKQHAAQRRWEDAHGVPWQHTAQIDAMCAWCAETIARDIPYNPRHADSEQEAVAICHGLVEYHIINGCEVHQRLMKAMAAEGNGGQP